MIERAIEIAASYRLNADDLRACLELESDQRSDTIVTVIHERAVTLDAATYDLLGHASECIQVCDGESLTFVVRRRGSIVACLVSEVCCEERSRLLLLPKGGFNLVLYQSRLDSEERVAHHVRLQQAGPAARGLERLFRAVLEHYQFALPGDIALVQESIEGAISDGNEQECVEVFLALTSLLDDHGALHAPAIHDAILAAALTS